MRSALLCVFFTLIVQRGGSGADSEFRPTPIPLDVWDYENRETPQTLPKPVVAAFPAHYWEDALRHSVYLTLVRDKIDQLIAKGDVISPDSKPDEYTSKEVDDHDLWEKIKTAPFDRIPEAEHASYGDVTIMAKGRLMEEKGGFRFSEDERNKEKCSDEKCREGVKAFWSVKRVRQRDAETSPGKYHYELTFSVISQTPKKQRKPYENPPRTFTVWETDPDKVVEMPQEHRVHERIQPHTQRPQRAVWIHKNIKPRYINHSHQHGLERLFSSLFSDEDYGYEQSRYRPLPPHLPPLTQHSKAGYVGSPSDQQKRLTPYPYKPHSYKYSRPLPPPPHHPHYHYSHPEIEGHYTPPSDHRYPSMKPVKTTRPFLPTPPTPTLPTKNWTGDDDSKRSNITDHTTREPEIVTVHYSKPRPGMKVSYLPEHVRPPIYNAPPGVFVTMDKKPFKPMPPLKLMTKPVKSHKPTNFRPSPQVLDMQQFSEPDPLFDTAFRPITWNYSDTNTTEKSEVAESSTQVNNMRKSTTKGKKPPKKHENIKSQIITTEKPDIITASNDYDYSEQNDGMGWANIIGAFTKTTPMASDTNKNETPSESTTNSPSSTANVIVSTKKKTTTTTEAAVETTLSTTPRPPKRTRPPHKFNKSEKIKKHKRITTTTTTNSPATEKTPQDLTPQASSSLATKPTWSVTTNAQSTTSAPPSTTTTTARPSTTTTRATTTTTTTTTTQPPTTSTEAKVSVGTTQPKAKNRFRQSTLMQKGTSVNHDKWSSITTDKRPVGSKYPRRKGSNFQGYISTTTQKNTDIQDNHHEDQVTTSQPVTTKLVSTTEVTYEDYENNRETADYSINQGEELVEENYDKDEKTKAKKYQEQETRDHSEFIFQTTTTPNERTNEIVEKAEESITTEEYTTMASKNRTKCKKRKLNTTTTEPSTKESHIEPPAPSTTTSTTTITPSSSFFDELFNSFTASQDNGKKTEKESASSHELQEQESENHAEFVKIDDDLQDFLDSIGEGKMQAENSQQYEDDEDEPTKDVKDSSVFEYEDDEDTDAEASARDSDRFDYHERPYSLLELMEIE